VYVCICRAVTTRTILELAAAGVRRTNEVGERCGAGTVCAKCRPTIRRLLMSADDVQRETGSLPARTPPGGTDGT
jgi:bacterioferritin-associated ferredoxin